jgi:PST family polysaccharide transporter
MNRQIVENLASLYGVQGLSMLLPLLYWPWLARVLGPAATGQLAMAEAAARFVALGIEYGFGFSATRDIAQAPDTAARARVARSVFAGQVALSAAAGALFGAAALIMPALRPHGALAAVAFLWGAGLGWNPAWYFQGRERIKPAAAVEAACRLIAVAGALLLVRGPDSVWVAATVNAGSSLCCAALNWRTLLRETPLGRVRLAEGLSGLRAGFQVFLFRCVVSTYTTANVLLLALLARPEAAGLFAAAEKLVKAGTSALYPISQAMYPRLSRLAASNEAAAGGAVIGALRVTLALGLIIGGGMAAASEWIVRLAFGAAFAAAAPVLRMLSVVAPLIAVSNVFGLQWMLAQRMDKALNKVLVAGAAAGLVLALALAPRLEAVGMSIAVLGAEAIIAAGTVACVMRSGRSPWLAAGLKERMA